MCNEHTFIMSLVRLHTGFKPGSIITNPWQSRARYYSFVYDTAVLWNHNQAFSIHQRCIHCSCTSAVASLSSFLLTDAGSWRAACGPAWAGHLFWTTEPQTEPREVKLSALKGAVWDLCSVCGVTLNNNQSVFLKVNISVVIQRHRMTMEQS